MIIFAGDLGLIHPGLLNRERKTPADLTKLRSGLNGPVNFDLCTPQGHLLKCRDMFT